MVHVPLTAGAVLPRPSPVCEGDIEALCDVLEATLVGVQDCHRSAASADRSLESSRGNAMRALGNRLAHLQTSAGLVEETATAALPAVQRYAREIDTIHARARTTQEDVVSMLSRVRVSGETIEEIARRQRVPVSADWRTPPPYFMPEPEGATEAAEVTGSSGGTDLPGVVTGSSSGHSADSFNWSIAAGAWAEAVSAIEANCATWRALVSQREQAERALVGALARTTLVERSAGASAPRAASVRALTLLLSQQRPWESPDLQRLLGGLLSPEEVAKAWRQLEASGANTDTIIAEHSVELAGLDGLPFAVRDRAGRTALDYALRGETELADTFARLGLTADDTNLAEFRRDLEGVEEALSQAEQSEDGSVRVVQLAMLGSHDGAVTAAMSVGDLDAAGRVGVLVSGMNSSVRGMSEVVPGFHELQGNAAGVAVVSWVGYRAPNISEELLQGRAERGSWPLASFLDGITTARGGAAPERLVLLGHSYGSNVAAEALKLGGHSVHAFVSIGSAGLKYSTTASDLDVAEIHATHAKGDNIAPLGRKAHLRSTSDGGVGYLPRVDPRDLEGAHVFSSERSADGKAVTMHNLMLPIDWGGLQWAADSLDGVARADEVGYLDPSSTTVQQLIEIMEVPK